MDKNKYKGYILTGLICAGLTFGTCLYFMDYNRRDIIENGKRFALIAECEDYLKSVKSDITDEDYRAKAVSGYIRAVVNDKYAEYYEDNDITTMTGYVNTSGTATASGFEIDRSTEGNILVTKIEAGLAADKQGIKEGDEIIKIGDLSVSDSGYENVADKLLGKQDTIVDLTLKRDGEIIDIAFKRDHTYINAVEGEIMDGIGYVGIKSFDQLSKGQFDQAFSKVEECDEIIIDLRDNPGGDADVAVEYGAQLTGHCKVHRFYFTGKDDVVEKLYDNPRCEGKKICLLVNEKTASAAEILTATIKQNSDAQIVGVNTFGKGIYQNTKDFEEHNGHLRYTAGYYTVGDWECYDGIGIAPDIEVKMDSKLIGTEKDVQLQKAIELLS